MTVAPILESEAGWAEGWAGSGLGSRRWTPEQWRAIERRQGDLLLDAGAGSGKTSVLVERFVRAVLVDGVDVSAILTITFTEKAAAELRDRINERWMRRGVTMWDPERTYVDAQARLAADGEQPPKGRRWVVAICGPQASAREELGPQFEATFDQKKADFAMALGTFYCRHLQASIMATVEREGVVYAQVYDLRGRPTPNLLTQPPP